MVQFIVLDTQGPRRDRAGGGGGGGFSPSPHFSAAKIKSINKVATNLQKNVIS